MFGRISHSKRSVSVTIWVLIVCVLWLYVTMFYLECSFCPSACPFEESYEVPYATRLVNFYKIFFTATPWLFATLLKTILGIYFYFHHHGSYNTITFLELPCVIFLKNSFTAPPLPNKYFTSPPTSEFYQLLLLQLYFQHLKVPLQRSKINWHKASLSWNMSLLS